MDREENNKIQKLIKNGRSPNDEGPFYHHAFWESYKGSVKGKLGGTVIGVLAGAVVGTAIFLLMPAAALGGLGALGVIGGMAAAGMLYANAEFSSVGRITGAVSATAETAEDRMQAFEQSRFNELKQDINDIKSMIGSKPNAATQTATVATTSNTSSPQATPDCEIIDQKLDDYRTTHHDPSIPKSKNNDLVFWKIAVIGAVVGTGVGLLLSAVGATALAASLPLGLGGLVIGTPGAAITGGVIGASFGINRDLFRRIFDKTDLLFTGMFNSNQQAPAPEQPTLNASKDRPEVNTLVYPDTGIEYPTSDTFHRDQLAVRANQLLHSMDHTTASRH